MPTDYEGQFETVTCPNHPERTVVDWSVCTKRLCKECIEQRLANYADQRAQPYEGRYQDEHSTDGRSIYLDNQGYYRTTASERNDV